METLFFLYIKKDMIYQEYPYLKDIQEVKDVLENILTTIEPDEWYVVEKFFDKDKWETLRIVGGNATININFPTLIIETEENTADIADIIKEQI